MNNDILLLIALAWSGIQFGTLWIMQTSILPLMNTRTKEPYLDTCQGIYMHFFHPIALWGGIAVMVAGVYLATQFEGSARVGAILAALGMVGVGAISEAINRPIWRRIEKWTYADMPADWQQLRKTWSTAHTLRTASAFLAVVAFCATAIIRLT
jgi:hypothetical protein